MGELIYAWRIHPYHDREIPQEIMAGWAGISQATLSRLEVGPPLNDLAKLVNWARLLHIPPELLWFAMPETYQRGTAVTPDGAKLVQARKDRRWGQLRTVLALEDAARDLNVGLSATRASLKTMVSRWEHGAPMSEFYQELYSAAFDTTPEDLGFHRPPTLTGRGEGNEKSAPQSSRQGGDDDHEEVSSTDRRTAVKVASTAILSVSQGSRVIQALDVMGNDYLDGIADGLGELVDHYAQAICALPPADVYDELLSVRSYVGEMIERVRFAQRHTDLVVANGWLSNLLAIASCDMGEHAAARVWCFDAERRGREARYPELAAWALLTKSMIAFYQGQPRRSVALAAQGKTMVPVGTVIHAKLATQEMRAAAMVGDAAHVMQARRHAAEAISHLRSDAKTTGAFSISVGEDPPYTATSLLLTGRFREAASAATAVIQTVYQPEARRLGQNPSGYARALLILAIAQARLGRLDEAVATGHAALSTHRPAWPTMVLAGMLDKALTRDFGDTADAIAYHARYEDMATYPTGYHLQLPEAQESK